MSWKGLSALLLLVAVATGGYGWLQRGNVLVEAERAAAAVLAKGKADAELKTAREQLAAAQAALKAKEDAAAKAIAEAKSMDGDLSALQAELRNLLTAKAAAEKAAADAAKQVAAEKTAREVAEAALAAARKQ